MPNLDASIAGATANAYADVAAGDAYFDERLNAAAWTGEADVNQKARALIQATRRLEAETFRGAKVSSNQALKWPRTGAYDDDGNEYAHDEIPTAVVHGMFELALTYLAASEDPLANTGLEGFKNVKVGSLDVTPNHGHKAAELPEVVRRLLGDLLATARGSVTLLRA